LRSSSCRPSIAAKQKWKISKDPIFRFGYNIQRYIGDNDVNIQANSDTEEVIDHLVDRKTVRIHDRGDIDISNVDIEVADKVRHKLHAVPTELHKNSFLVVRSGSKYS
jgi:hypothetical protein